MCLPLLLNLTQFSVVFDLNHPKPHRLRGENPATFLEVKKIRLSCHFCLHTHKSSVISTQVQMDGWRSTKSPPAGFSQGVSSAEPNPPSQNPPSKTPTNDAFGTRVPAAGFRLNVRPLAAGSSFIFVKTLLGRPGFKTLAPQKIFPTVWTSFREFLVLSGLFVGGYANNKMKSMFSGVFFDKPTRYFWCFWHTNGDFIQKCFLHGSWWLEK